MRRFQPSAVNILCRKDLGALRVVFLAVVFFNEEDFFFVGLNITFCLLLGVDMVFFWGVFFSRRLERFKVVVFFVFFFTLPCFMVQHPLG